MPLKAAAQILPNWSNSSVMVYTTAELVSGAMHKAVHMHQQLKKGEEYKKN